MKKAVIDMGTNSTRLAVAAWNGGNLDMLYNEVAETRLGEGMGKNVKFGLYRLPVM